MKQWVSLTLLVLMLGSMLLSGCTDHTQPTQVPQTQTTAGTTSAAAQERNTYYLEDYQQFWEILETDYPYLPLLETRYPKLQQWRDEDEKKAAEITTDEEFYDLLQGLCYDFDFFAHLCILTPNAYQAYYNLYCMDDSISNLPHDVAYREVLMDPNLDPMYQVPQDDYVPQQEDTIPEVEVKYYDDCDALLLVIQSFDHSVVERDRTVLADALKQYPNTKHIIFDIQDNGGGDDFYWRMNLVSPLDDFDEISWQYPLLFYRNTPRIATYFDSYTSAPVSELTDIPDWVTDLKLDRYMTVSEENDVRDCPFDPEIATSGKDAKRWLLVSNRTYSSAEAFTIFCKATGWATLIGSKTGGDGIGVTPVLVKLKNSGLIVRFSAVAAENITRGQPSAFGGTEPDYPGGLTQCLELIRAESGS